MAECPFLQMMRDIPMFPSHLYSGSSPPFLFIPPLALPPFPKYPHHHHYYPYIINHSASSCLIFPSLFLMFSSFFNPLRCSGAHCIHSSLDWYLTTPNLNISYFTDFPFSHPPHIPLSCAALSLPIFPSPPPYPPILTIPVPCSPSPISLFLMLPCP